MIINRHGQYWRLKLIKLYIALDLVWVYKLNDSMNKRITNVGLDKTKRIKFFTMGLRFHEGGFIRVIYYYRDTLSVLSDKPSPLFLFNLIRYTSYYKINNIFIEFNYVFSLARKKTYITRKRLLTKIKTILTQLIETNEDKRNFLSRAISILSHFSVDENIDGIC